MRERYIFFIGVGVGIVFTSLAAFFSYNLYANKVNLEKTIETTTENLQTLTTQTLTEQVSTTLQQSTQPTS